MINKTWINVIQINNKSKKITIRNIYRSPKNNIKEFCDKIIEYCGRLVDEGRVIVVGDFNVDMNNSVLYPKKLKDKMAFFGLEQKIDESTTVNFASATIINLVFTNFKFDAYV